MKNGRAVMHGVLLAQLGSPDSPALGDVRSFLGRFLMDPQLVRVPRFWWKPLLQAVILPRYTARAAARYARIWTAQGSPLTVITMRQAQGVEARLRAEGLSCRVVCGMLYGRPSIENGMEELVRAGCKHILLFPMFPQYSSATNPAIEDAAVAALKGHALQTILRVAKPFFKAVPYIEATAENLNRFLSELPRPPQKLLLSYHGLPQSFVQEGDLYCSMCAQTTALLLPRLNFPAERVLHCYQSRFGAGKWVAPFIDETVRQLAQTGIKYIAVACPGFLVDCVETLYEIRIELAQLFRDEGGKEFEAVPCLNDDVVWLEALAALIRAELKS